MLQNQKRTQESNNKLISGVQKTAAMKRRAQLLATGAVPFADAEKRGFYKVAWDLYRTNEEPDGGPIWTVADVDGEQWLVVHTDIDDTILRNVAKSYLNPHPIKSKVASAVKTAVVFNPGDLVEVQPEPNTINWKYRGQQGKVTASLIDKTALAFGDGSSLWFENRDLKKVEDGDIIELGDTVRMFSNRTLSGKVVKVASGLITFENEKGMHFSARPKDIIKVAAGADDGLVLWGPAKFVEKSLRAINEGRNGMPSAQSPAPMDEEPAEMSMGGPEGGMGGANLGAGTGSPVGGGAGAAQSLGGPGGGAGALNMAASKYTAFVKRGRVLIVNDTIQLKSSGETGTITQVGFDQKLGKYYQVAFGGTSEPRTIFDTDIIKMNKTQQGLPSDQQVEAPSGAAIPVNPDMNRALRASSALNYPGNINRMVPDDTAKTAALQFVGNIVQSAMAEHEKTNPGERMSPNLQSAIVSKAIDRYINSYMDSAARQVMASDDKQKFGTWLFEQLLPGQPHERRIVELQDVQTSPQAAVANANLMHQTKMASIRAAALDLISEQCGSADRTEVGFDTVSDQDKFYSSAYNLLLDNGMDSKAAKIITAAVAETGQIGSAFTHKQLAKLAYSPLTINQMFETATAVLDKFIVKKAVGLPGMEALRGGGGGFPGGADIEPMKWEVKKPGNEAPENMDMLNSALQENFAPQGGEVVEPAPKIDVQLDPEQKKIVIDYNQEPDQQFVDPQPTDEAQGQGPEGISPSTPGKAGAPAPGSTAKLPGSGSGESVQDFGNMNVPTSF